MASFEVMGFTEWVSLSARFFEGAGVLVMVLGTLLAIVRSVIRRNRSIHSRYRVLRQRIGAAILLGLELLVAADIIRTIAERPTLDQVAVLGCIVLIRTFLSFTLAVELEGRWPWQRQTNADAELVSPKASERRSGAQKGEGGQEGTEGQPPAIN